MADAMDRKQPKQRPKRRRIARTLRPGETLVTDEGVEVQVVGKSRHPGSVRVVVTLPQTLQSDRYEPGDLSR